MFGYYKFRRIIKNILIKKNINIKLKFNYLKKSEELLLFGNGYTLNNVNFELIENKDVFVSNSFFKINNYLEFTQKNNVMHFALDTQESIRNLAKKRCITFEEALEEFVYPSVNEHVQIVRTFDFIEIMINKFPNIKIIDNHTLLKSVNIESLNVKFIKGLGHTPQFMILVGILLGYKKIHLYGLEHNYVRDILNKDPKCGTHFYGDTYREVLEQNNGKNLERENYKVVLSKLFEQNSKTFDIYEKLSVVAFKNGVEIIDHSNGSLFMFQDYSLWDLVEPQK